VTEPDEGYHRLRQAILQGQFMPNERLIETDLAKAFHLGRAAIRTALARLEQDGLVEREPFRGARVRSILVDEAIEILETRAVLEGLAVRHAAAHATTEDVTVLRATLEQMRARYAADDLLGVSEGNSQLHRQLLQIAQHQTAARLIDILQAQNVRYQFRTILVPGRALHSLDEHRAIIDAVATGDADAAEKAMRRHLDHVANTLRHLARGPLDDAVPLTNSSGQYG
jgi:DNA-binding GntR family transcriptional regulator